MDILILFGVFVMLLMIGVPVAFSLAAAALATLAYIGLPPLILAQQVAAGAGSASLVAIPLFILAGEIMMRGGISERLIGLASAMVGRMRGGLGQVSIVSSLFFGGVSGSAIADVSAVGGAMIPQMVQRGYARDYAVNVSINAALVALLVPPSHNLILFSAAAAMTNRIAAVESAAIAVLYALLVACVVHRKLGWSAFLDTLTHAARTTGAILFVIAAAAAFGWLLAYLEVPAATVEAMRAVAHSKLAILLLIVVALLLLGTFMDLAPMMNIPRMEAPSVTLPIRPPERSLAMEEPTL